MKNNGTVEFGKLQLQLFKELEDGVIDQKTAQYRVEDFWAGKLREAAIEGNIENGSLMAGQSVGFANEIKSIKGIFEEMTSDAEIELQKLNSIFNS